MNRSDFQLKNFVRLEIVFFDVTVKHLVPLQLDLLGPYTNHRHMPCSRTPEGVS